MDVICKITKPEEQKSTNNSNKNLPQNSSPPKSIILGAFINQCRVDIIHIVLEAFINQRTTLESKYPAATKVSGGWCPAAGGSTRKKYPAASRISHQKYSAAGGIRSLLGPELQGLYTNHTCRLCALEGNEEKRQGKEGQGFGKRVRCPMAGNLEGPQRHTKLWQTF